MVYKYWQQNQECKLFFKYHCLELQNIVLLQTKPSKEKKLIQNIYQKFFLAYCCDDVYLVLVLLSLHGKKHDCLNYKRIKTVKR